MGCSIVWFRNDLRLADNPALTAALRSGQPVVPVYVLDESVSVRPLGSAARWWLHHSLVSLDRSLRALGSRLVLRRGPAEQVLEDLVGECEASGVTWSRGFVPGSSEVEDRLRRTLLARGVTPESHNGNLLYAPWEVKTQADEPFRVFTAFWQACRRLGPPLPCLPAPSRLAAPSRWPASDDLDDWQLLPSSPDWAGGLRETWTPGEAGAQARLATFLDERLGRYAAERDVPAVEATSCLSPHLAFGEIAPRQIWHAVTLQGGGGNADKFLSEVGWREFAYHLVFHFGNLAQKNFRPEFNAFPWRASRQAITAWQHGRTGYPIVDAGMRQLWHTGWMHNRVRMIVASFLTKDLMADWRVGERWFWDTLVDADLANNATGWQWVAGCGADAAPYFRIFNPVLQGQKFDPGGDYVRRWLPELAHLPAALVHQPWMAGDQLSKGAYPERIVDHGAARTRALEAFKGLRRSA